MYRGGTLSVQRSLGEKNGPNLFFSNIDSGDMLVVAVPYRAIGGDIVGAIILYQSLQNLVETTLNRAKWQIVYAAGIAIVMTTFFAFFLSTRISSPVLTMKKAADQIMQGNFKMRVPIRTTDEIGDLARTFNRMAEILDPTIQDLSREKEHLSSILNSMTDGVLTVDETGGSSCPTRRAGKCCAIYRSATNRPIKKRFVCRGLCCSFISCWKQAVNKPVMYRPTGGRGLLSSRRCIGKPWTKTTACGGQWLFCGM